MYDAVPPKLKRTLVTGWDFLAVNHKEGSVGKIQHRGLLGRRVVQMLPFFLEIDLRHYRQPPFAVYFSSPAGAVFSTTHPVTQEPPSSPSLGLARTISTFTWVKSAAIAPKAASTGAMRVTTPPTATPVVSGTSKSTSSSWLRTIRRLTFPSAISSLVRSTSSLPAISICSVKVCSSSVAAWSIRLGCSLMGRLPSLSSSGSSIRRDLRCSGPPFLAISPGRRERTMCGAILPYCRRRG